MIWEKLTPAMILPGLEVSTSDEVMETVGGAVVRAGYAKLSYLQALKDREKDYPTGLDVDGFGVAIPHTAVDHVLKSGVAIATLKQPVTFVQMGTDDETVEVRVIFMLAVTDPNDHIDELQQILAILQDTAVLQKLMNVENAEQIIALIREKENAL